MKEYRVLWVIEVDGETPTEAALAAQIIQRAPNSIASVFDVCPRCDCGDFHPEETTSIDLLDKENHRVH